MIIAGAVAQHVAPSDVIAATGLLGTVAAIAVALFSRNRGKEAEPSGPAV
jgi:hypothetical protein